MRRISTTRLHGWVDPKPSIRVSGAKYGKVLRRAHELDILDKDGNVVATVISSTDGEPVIGCGAKVAIVTKYDTEVRK
jgi:hypothetical protein